jgi:choline monooxygenase
MTRSTLTERRCPWRISPVTDWTDEAAWARTRRPMRTATGLDPAAYASDGFYFVEQQRVFGQAWVCAGIADEAVAGRMLVRQVGSKSVLLTRNETGDLRGFINSCRHRGTELAEADCDVAGTIRCPYHRWGYSLDGALKATPFFDEVLRDDNFDKADFGLLSVRVDTWGVLLFVCLSDDTPPLLDWLGDLPDRMAGYRLDTWSTVHQESLEIRANWKLITENFQEYYHLTWVHPELAKVSRVADHYRYQGSGMYCGQTTTPVSGDERNEWLTLPEAPGLDESDSVSGRFVAIFPNVILSVLPNHIWMMRLDPIAPGLTRETCTMLLPAGVQDVGVAVDGAVAVGVDGACDPRNDAIAPTRRFWADVNDEDIDIVQRGQRGLARGGVPAGPLAPRFEEPLHRFHNMLADCMTNDGLGTLEVPIGDQPGDTWGAGVNPTPAAIDR